MAEHLLVVMLIDGISEHYFHKNRHKRPHLDHLARRGTLVNALSPEICGTSLPGRSAILTGVDSSRHGVYGNQLFDTSQGRFRNAHPDDLRVPTVLARAKQAGRQVAAVGFGMAHPRDTQVYIGPWWARDMIRGRHDEMDRNDKIWEQAAGIVDPKNYLAELTALGLDTEFVQVPSDEPGHLIRGTLADQQVVDLVAGLGCSTRRPDLIIAEIGMPDHALHTFGYDSPEAEWSVRLADAQIGTLMMRLREHAVPTNLVILSDHGHMDMQHAINVTALTDLPHSCEGQTILIGNTDPAAMTRVDHALRELHCEQWPDHVLPIDAQGSVRLYVAPEGYSFENCADSSEIVVSPSALSTHGLRPGHPRDHRLCLLAGPDIPTGQINASQPGQVTATIAHLLGIDNPLHAFANPLL